MSCAPCTNREVYLREALLFQGKLTTEELTALDALADAVEIQRLHKMSVLTDPISAPANAKTLSTRTVRTWREKVDSSGRAVWL